MFDKLKSQQPFSCGPLHSGKVQRQQAGEMGGWGGFQCTSFLFLEQVQFQKRDLNGNT